MAQDVIANNRSSTAPAPAPRPAPAPAPAAMGTAVTWTIVPDRTTVNWTASKRYFMVIPVKANGHFSGATGTVKIDGKDLTTARVNLTAPTASQDSGMARRDKHLQGPDFFDAVANPQITFTSTAIRRLPGHAERYAVEGNLGIRGAQKPVTLEGTWQPIAGGWARVELTGTVSRSELGLTWNGKPMINLLDPIELRIEAELQPTGR